MAVAEASWKRVARRTPLVPTLYRRLRRGRRYLQFARDFRAFRAQGSGLDRLPLKWDERLPCLGDQAGTIPFEPHYLYHPAWALRVLARTRPARHVDVSSTLPFVAMASAIVPVDYYEYRPPHLELDNVRVFHGDLLALPMDDASVGSLSCMHTIEHVGLGRYGDPIDPLGDLKAAAELKRVLAPGGSLLVVVPVGRPRVRFNANRIYGYDDVLALFEGLRLEEYLLVADDARLSYGASPQQTDVQEEGCGCFWFINPSS